MSLNDDAYYHCNICKYKVKSPALQDQEVLNKSDFLSIVSLYHDYIIKVEYTPTRAEAMLAAIDYIRGLPENCMKYEYQGANGIYKPEYNAQIRNVDMWINVGKGRCLGEWVLMNTLFPIVGSVMPPPYSYMFSIVTNALMQEHPGANQISGTDIITEYAFNLADDLEIIPHSVAVSIDALFAFDSLFNGTSCTSECYNVNMVFLFRPKSEGEECYQINYHYAGGAETLSRGGFANVSMPGTGDYACRFSYHDEVNDREYNFQE